VDEGRLIADPDGTYGQLLDERFGRLADVARERHRRPSPPPPAPPRRRRPLSADDEPRENE
jgi:hypothetical protein